jgi:glycine/D-amino acid oxidase-like deaminating enzyme
MTYSAGRITANRMDGITVGGWIDGAKHLFSAYLETTGGGFKIADDTRGPAIDPSEMEREISQEELSAAREYLGMRFPSMINAPPLESRVCQYDNSIDHNFILDCHPEAGNVWVVGGGSGHGFKHGPVTGEIVANVVLEIDSPLGDGFRSTRSETGA